MLFTGFKFVFGNIFLIFNFISSFYFCYIRHFCYTICSEVVIVNFETVGLFSNQRHCIYFYLDHLLEIMTLPNHLHHLDTTQSVLETSLSMNQYLLMWSHVLTHHFFYSLVVFHQYYHCIYLSLINNELF